MANIGKELKELKAEQSDIEQQLVEGQANKKALMVKLKEMEGKIQGEYTDAVDRFAVGELVEKEGNLLDRVLKTRQFDENRNLKAQAAKVKAGLDALNQHLTKLAVKRKELSVAIGVLENKLLVESLKRSHSLLIEAIKQAEAAFAEYHRLQAQAPHNVVDVAQRLGLVDPFFIASISRVPKPGESLLTWISKASGLAIAENPLYGKARQSGQGHFKRGGLRMGVTADFQAGK